MSRLAEAEVRLDIHARLEVSDTLRTIRRAMELLDREIPHELRDDEPL